MALIVPAAVYSGYSNFPPLFQPAVDYVLLSLADDIDFRDDAGPTKGVLPRGLYIVGAGSFKVDTFFGGIGRIVPVAANTRHDLVVTKLYSTANGTTATNIFAIV